MTRIAYNLALLAALPFIVPRLLWRSRRQPEYLENVGERFGAYPRRKPRPTLWLHAVSVGETRAAQPLVTRLLESYPDHELVITHMTPTGRQTSADLFGNRVTRCYLPYDYPWAMSRFLDHFAPRVGIVLETEIWPNLIAACGARHLPLLLVNARMSDKSARRYARWPKLAAAALRGFAAIAAQTDMDAQHLLRLGAREAKVFGNMK
ncbi:MAG: glycosyltransferase N-terminal domain-containing protein, partial [Rhodocyclaceae bacterium]